MIVAIFYFFFFFFFQAEDGIRDIHSTIAVWVTTVERTPVAFIGDAIAVYIRAYGRDGLVEKNGELTDVTVCNGHVYPSINVEVGRHHNAVIQALSGAKGSTPIVQEDRRIVAVT